MNTKHALRLLAAASLLFASHAFALDPAAAGADALQVEPRVPNAAGTPCVVTLFTNRPITDNRLGGSIAFVPPAACPGPWAKVKLILELSGPRQGPQPGGAIRLVAGDPQDPEGQYASGAIWLGSPQITDDIPTWRIER